MFKFHIYRESFKSPSKIHQKSLINPSKIPQKIPQNSTRKAPKISQKSLNNTFFKMPQKSLKNAFKNGPKMALLSTGRTKGEPFIVCVLIKWSSRKAWISSTLASTEVSVSLFNKFNSKNQFIVGISSFSSGRLGYLYLAVEKTTVFHSSAIVFMPFSRLNSLLAAPLMTSNLIRSN